MMSMNRRSMNFTCTSRLLRLVISESDLFEFPKDKLSARIEELQKLVTNNENLRDTITQEILLYQYFLNYPSNADIHTVISDYRVESLPPSVILDDAPMGTPAMQDPPVEESIQEKVIHSVELFKVELLPMQKREDIKSTCFSANHLMAVGKSNSQIFLYNYNNDLFAILGSDDSLNFGYVSCLEVNSKWILAGYSMGVIAIWDIQSFKLVKHILPVPDIHEEPSKVGHRSVPICKIILLSENEFITSDETVLSPNLGRCFRTYLLSETTAIKNIYFENSSSKVHATRLS
jgi:hypothetical protein